MNNSHTEHRPPLVYVHSPFIKTYNRGEHKEQLVTFWKKKNGAANSTKAASAQTSATFPTQETIQQANDLRNALKNSSQAIDGNGEPPAVFHGTDAVQFEEDPRRLKKLVAMPRDAGTGQRGHTF
jgi:hypothetical protein